MRETHRPRRGARALLMLGAITAAPWALAEAAAPAPTHVVADVEQDAALREVLAELLGRIHLDVTDRGAAPLARVAIRARGDEIVVTVWAGDDVTPWVTRKVSRGSSPWVTRETVAHIALGAVESIARSRGVVLRRAVPSALTSGSAPATPPSRAPEAASSRLPPVASAAAQPPAPSSSLGTTGPVAAQERPPASTRRTFVAIEAGGFVYRQGEGGFAGGPYFGFRIGAMSRWMPEGELRATYSIPNRLEVLGVEGTLHHGGVYGAFRVSPYNAARYSASVGALAGAEWVVMDPTRAQGFALQAPSTRLQPVVGMEISGRYAIFSHAALAIHLGFLIDLAPRTWVLQEGTAQHSFFELSRVRPYLMVGVDTDFGQRHALGRGTL